MLTVVESSCALFPQEIARQARRYWILASGIGCGAGAMVAVLLIPDAGFTRSPVGEFGGHLVWFGLILGTGLGCAQVLVFCLIPRAPVPSRVIRLWVPATALGFVVMVVPIYGIRAYEVVEPALLVPAIAPGVVALGLGQWCLLRQSFNAKGRWVLRTAVGVVVGAVVGAVAGVLFGSPETLVFGGGYEGGGVVESIWAGVTGLGMGVAQAEPLVKDLRVPSAS